jgi:hypothetical protein
MARYRLKAWFPDKPDHTLIKFRSTDCKICALNWAQTTVREMEYNNKRFSGSSRWTLEKTNERAFHWEVYWHHGMPEVAVSKKHAHTEPHNRTSSTRRNT